MFKNKYDVKQLFLKNKLIIIVILVITIILTGLVIFGFVNNSKGSVIYITTENNQDIVDQENYIDCNVSVKDSLFDTINFYLEDEKAQIRGRGATTWYKSDRKPCKLKLDSKQSLLGLPSNKHWSLLANEFDPSAIRTELASTLSHAIGMEYTMKSKPVILNLNGEDLGLYTLVETIRIDNNRVNITDINDDITDWKDSDINNEDIGGFILDYEELDKYHDGTMEDHFITTYGTSVQIEDPENVTKKSKYKNLINDYYQKFENAAFSTNFHTFINNNYTRYSDLCDINSIAKYWVAMQVSCNVDSFRFSTHFYKDFGQKMKMGPLWDFDKAFGCEIEDIWQLSDDIYGSYYPVSIEGKSSFISNIVKDPYFICSSYNNYLLAKPYIENLTINNGIIDLYVNELKKSKILDFIYFRHIDLMKSNLNKQIAFLKSNTEDIWKFAKSIGLPEKSCTIKANENNSNWEFKLCNSENIGCSNLDIEINGRRISSINAVSSASNEIKFSINKEELIKIAYEDSPANPNNSNILYSDCDNSNNDEISANVFLHDKNIININNYYICVMINNSETGECIAYDFINISE